MSYDPQRYLRYDELTAQLREWAAAYPHLMRLEEIGRSREGRPIWGVTLTNQATGDHRDKPGYLVDANVHAGEVTGGAAAVYAIGWLLTRYGQDPLATELLDTRAYYVVPRIAVDGAEVYLTTPYALRSSPRLYPHTEELPGFYPEDVNGDGHILQMRKLDPEGDWKADDKDPRILVRRAPDDRGPGPFYRVFTEGLIKDWDGKGIPPVRRRWGLDMNRNYPAFWNPEHKQPGAGPYPLSEPETRALANFLLGHPNIGGYLSMHTTGCVLLRPPSNGGDDKMDQADLEMFGRIGEVATRLTGYPCKSTYDAFGYPGQEALVKGADDWAYEHFGVQAYTCELWSIDVKSGAKAYATVGVKGLMQLTDQEWVEEERKRLAWADANIGPAAFIPWTPFEHPQLGAVEIGGWELKRCLQNPPEGPLLEAEISKVAAFTFQHALAMPRLAVELKATELGAGLYKLTARVRNLGGLSTCVTQQAIAVKAVRPVTVTLDAPAGARIVSGQARQEIGHLEGWLSAGGRPARDEAWIDWVIQAPRGTTLSVTAHTARAGRATATLAMGEIDQKQRE